MMTTTMVIEIIKIVITLAIPVIIFVMGRRFNHLSLVAKLTEHLGSENRKRRLIALMLMRHLRKKGALPQELLNSVSLIAASDDPEVAGAAELVLRREDIAESNLVLLIELFAPLKVHFDRTRAAFEDWTKFNETLENEIMNSNKFIRDRLVSRWHLIPDALKEDARKLIIHYDAWLKKYEQLRPDGIRDVSQPFVFVGPNGYPFPTDSEQKFITKYEELIGNST